jgi:hypothetical protein
MECDLTCGRRPAETRGIPAVLGVIVLAREPITDSGLKTLIANQKVVVLLRQEEDAFYPNTGAMLSLVNFLAGIRRRAFQLGDLRVEPLSYDMIRDESATSV